MKKELKEKFPKWIENGEKNGLILSDDIDSLMCYIFLRDNFDYQIRYFYDVNGENYTHKIYKQENYKYNKNIENVIAIDLALEGCKCWDNHIVKVNKNDTYNKNSANLNAIDNICNSNYTDKWCVSTYITMLSYYNVDIKNWTRDQLAILCSIDGLYYPFLKNYSSRIDFRSIARKHLKQLEYEFLEEFIDNNLDYILKIKKDLKLDSKIKINKNGYFETDLDLKKLSEIFKTDISLTKDKCELTQVLHKQFIRNKDKQYIKDTYCKNKKMRNFALVKKDCAVFSY